MIKYQKVPALSEVTNEWNLTLFGSMGKYSSKALTSFKLIFEFFSN